MEGDGDCYSRNRHHESTVITFIEIYGILRRVHSPMCHLELVHHLPGLVSFVYNFREKRNERTKFQRILFLKYIECLQNGSH